jgi:hypothetical protein
MVMLATKFTFYMDLLHGQYEDAMQTVASSGLSVRLVGSPISRANEAKFSLSASSTYILASLCLHSQFCSSLCTYDGVVMGWDG